MLKREQALERFVGNNRDLEKLESLLSEFNLFEAMGVARQELRHSDFLAFLLAPTQSHGLGAALVKRLLHRVISVSRGPIPLSSIDVDTWPLSEVEVRREWRNVDLLLTSSANRLVIVVENKLDSHEHSNQLQRYRDIVIAHHPGWKHVFILLSPHGIQATDLNYVAVSYADVAEILEIQLETSGRLDPAVRLGIEHYLKLLRRHVVDDSQIADLCRRIYQRHKQAIDLIVTHSKRTRDDIYAHLTALIRANDRFELDNPVGPFLRFALLRWDGPGFQEALQRGWTSSGRHMIFKFVVDSDRLKLWLIVGPGQNSRRQALIETGQDGPTPFLANPTGNKNYTQLVVYDLLQPSDFETLSYDEIVQRIDQFWTRFVEDDLPVIEKTMASGIAKLSLMSIAP